MGLSPEYYDGCTDDVLNLYAEVEDRIIADVVRRIIKTGDITETAKWQIRQAQQMGLLYDDIIKDIAKSTNKTDKEIKKMFENAGVETVNNDNRLHIQAGKSPLDIRQSESMLQILNGVYKNSLTDLKNLTGTTAITSQTAYYNACNSAFMMVSSGAFSYQQALRTVIQEVAEKGATVSYPSGHTDKLDVAVRRSLLTGIGLASRQISEENSKLCGCDLMEISAHSGARPSHATWQGQIVSLSGRRGYLSKSDIGYGTGAGFGGWNCRHDWYPFYEGISKRNYSQSDLDKLNAKDIKYNGKMYSEYEISQMLRQKEREIRALKREQVALKTAISEGQTFLKSDLTALNGKIREKSTEIQNFCKETNYKRDRFREQVSNKTSVGHGTKNNLTSKRNDGILSKEVAIQKAKLLSKDRNFINFIENNKATMKHHPLMRNLEGFLNYKNGFDGLPTIVDIHEFSNLSKEKTTSVIYRGVSSYKKSSSFDIINQFKNGSFFVGTGIYGCGTYTSYDRNIAVNYAQKADKANNNNGDISVFKMLINENMTFADYEEIKKEFDSLQSTASKLNKINEISNYEFFFRDIGVYATLKGYDGIKLNNYNGYNHVIILNRSKLVVINIEEDIGV